MYPPNLNFHFSFNGMTWNLLHNNNSGINSNMGNIGYNYRLNQSGIDNNVGNMGFNTFPFEPFIRYFGTIDFANEDDDEDYVDEFDVVEYASNGVEAGVIDSFKNHIISSKQVEDKEECSICMESYKLNESVYNLPCEHQYHKECIKTWLKSNNTCPICRYEFPIQKYEEVEDIDFIPDIMTDLTDDEESFYYTVHRIDDDDDIEDDEDYIPYEDLPYVDSESSTTQEENQPKDTNTDKKKEVIIIDDSDDK